MTYRPSGDRGKLSVPFRVLSFIRENDMTRPGDRVLAAVSGGADSVCMLHILSILQKELEISLFVFHVNHKARKDSYCDAEFTSDLSRRLGLPFSLAEVDMPGESARLGLSEEEAGRNLRYSALRNAALEHNCRRIAVAHNAGDLAETMIMNFFRGTGLKGLTGISPVREDIIRPLLCLERKEIEDYLCSIGETWVNDSTNSSMEYTRNRVRHEAIPWAEKNISENLISRLSRTAGILSDIQAHMEKEARALLDKAAPDGHTIDSSLMLDADPAVRREALLILLSNLTPHRKDITSKHIEILSDLMKGQGSAHIDLPYDLCAERIYSKVLLFKRGEAPALPPPASCTISLDRDKIFTQPVWRLREPGDYIINPAGQKRPLKKVFIDKKVPKAVRDSMPILCDGKEVLWVPGIIVSGRCTPGADSVHVQEFSWPQEGL